MDTNSWDELARYRSSWRQALTSGLEVGERCNSSLTRNREREDQSVTDAAFLCQKCNRVIAYKDMTVPKLCQEFLVAGKDTIVLHVAFVESSRYPYDTMKLSFENPETNKSKVICDADLTACNGQVSPECWCSGNKAQFNFTVRAPAKTEYSLNRLIFDVTRYPYVLKKIIGDESDFSVVLQVNTKLPIRLGHNRTCPLITPSKLGTKTYFQFCTAGLIRPVLYLRIAGRGEVSIENDCIAQAPTFQACVRYVEFNFRDECQRVGAFHCPLREPPPVKSDISVYMTVNQAYPIRIPKGSPCPLIKPSSNGLKTLVKFCVKGLEKPSLKLSHSGRTVQANKSECVLMANVFNNSIKAVTFSYEDFCRRSDTYECPIGDIKVSHVSKGWVWSEHIYEVLLILALLVMLLLAILGAVDFFCGFKLRHLCEEPSVVKASESRVSRDSKHMGSSLKTSSLKSSHRQFSAPSTTSRASESTLIS